LAFGPHRPYSGSHRGSYTRLAASSEALLMSNLFALASQFILRSGFPQQPILFVGVEFMIPCRCIILRHIRLIFCMKFNSDNPPAPSDPCHVPRPAFATACLMACRARRIQEQ
jgi:hypothetical protein